MEQLMDLFNGCVAISMGVIFLIYNHRLARALNNSEAAFLKSLDLFRVSPHKYLIPTKIAIVLSGLLFLFFGILSISSILSRK